MSQRVLVTGGAGFIGSHTVDLLLQKGYKVRVLDNLSVHGGKWPTYLDRRAERIKGDVCYKKHWEDALKNVDYVIHIAAQMDLLPEFSKYFQVNTVGTANLYEVIVENNLPIKKVVIASSQFVYGQGRWYCKKHKDVFPRERLKKRLLQGKWDPVCPICVGEIRYLTNKEDKVDPPNQYAISKYSQELIGLRLGEMYDIPSVALRYSIVHGARQSIKSLYSGALRQFVLYLMFDLPIGVYEDGKQLRDFVSVKDVAFANLTAMLSSDANFEAFNVGGDKAFSVLQLANLVGKVMKRDINVSKNGSYRVGDIRHAVSDISKLKRLGWRPKVTEETSIKEFVSWVKKIPLSKASVLRGVEDLEKKVKLGRAIGQS